MKTTLSKSDLLQDIENELKSFRSFDTIDELMEKYKPQSRTSFEEMRSTMGNRF